MHAAWDTSIPEKLNGGEAESEAVDWSKNLTQAINDGIFKDEKASRLSGMTLNDTTTSSLLWARDANAQVCTTVIPDGVQAVEDVDLGEAYFESAIDTVELQIARGEAMENSSRQSC